MAGKVIGRVLLALLLILLLLAVSGTAAHAAGLVDDNGGRCQRIQQIILWTHPALDFYVDEWMGLASRGTGWQVSENR